MTVKDYIESNNPKHVLLFNCKSEIIATQVAEKYLEASVIDSSLRSEVARLTISGDWE